MKRRGVKSCGGGFTLLELLLAVAIMAVVSAVTYLTFSTVVQAWRKGQVLSDNLHHGDFVMDQLVMGIRSAYYRGAPGSAADCGFWHKDNGSGVGQSDTICWVKMGTALVGDQCAFAGTPHRVEFKVDSDPDGERAVLVRSWRLLGHLEDFDPELDVKPEVLSRRVLGFDCRVAEKIEDGEIEWEDEWEHTNSLPRLVEFTLYMQPLAEGEEAVELKRIVRIPIVP